MFSVFYDGRISFIKFACAITGRMHQGDIVQDLNFTKPRKAKWRPSTSFWITSAIWLLLLLIFALAGGFGVWLVMFAVFVLFTALFSLLFGRRSWIGLPHRKAAGAGVGAGIATLVAGFIVVGATAPSVDLVDLKATSTATAAATASATTPHESLLLTECAVEAGTDRGPDGVYVCTADDAGKLVWMTESNSKTLISDIAATAKADADAAATKAAQEKAAVERVAAAKVAAKKAADKVAAEKRATEKAAAVKAAEQAAAAKAEADEAARVTAEQEAQQAPAPFVGDSGADAYYPNCAAARAAGVAPIYVGQPGYRAGLDRDHDGVACE